MSGTINGTISGAITIAIAAKTDVGLVRERNEDHVVIGDLDSGELLELDAVHERQLEVGERGPLAVVCDGMGGGEHGHVASKVAAETAWRELAAETSSDERVVFARQLRRSVRAANVAVRARAKSLSSQAMGTTAAVAGLVDRALVLALVGDCRASVFRGGRLTQVTRDQSVVSALVSAGALTDDEARASERRHMILQALGPAPDVDVSLSLVELRRGDTLLLSSDGLHGVLEERYLIAALREHEGDLLRALERLFGLAHSAGAPDNISAVLIRFSGDGLAPPRDSGDELLFTEIDPAEDGEAALTQTSRVARRLAHRAGLRPKLTEPPIPATGTHAVLTVPITAKGGPKEEGPIGPAEARLAAGSDAKALAWFLWLVVIATVVGVAYNLFG